ncbi:hypothetical protein PDJAM_G00061480, partial [Pangasius djambal]|nr:hypothetical protein [Pangasius djambal]
NSAVLWTSLLNTFFILTLWYRFNLLILTGFCSNIMMMDLPWVTLSTFPQELDSNKKKTSSNSLWLSECQEPATAGVFTAFRRIKFTRISFKSSLV